MGLYIEFKEEGFGNLLARPRRGVLFMGGEG